MIGGLKVVDGMKMPNGQPASARTNGRDIELDRAFVDSLTDEELRGLLLHENEHKALRQIEVYGHLAKDKNTHATLNQAMDYVANARIMAGDNGEGFIKLPQGGLYDLKYGGMSTKQVFDILMQGKKDKDQDGDGDGEGDGDGDGEGDGQKKPGKGKPKAGNGQQGFDDHDVEGAQQLTAEEREELKQDIDKAIRQGGLLAGQMGGGNKNMLDDVLESQIRWQEILAEFIKSVTKGRDNSSWARINRRWISSGMYLPSSISKTVGGLLIAGDASGSTWSGNQLAGFLGEAKAIIEDVQPDFVDFVWWDTNVTKTFHFTPEEYPTMIEKIKAIEGGGGTAPSCIHKWIKKQEPKKEYVAAIVLSDGQVGSDWGKWDDVGEGGGELPVLWCVNTKGLTSPVGQTLFIEDGQ
jgi:predicted metal-dependent peptidase